MTAEQIEYNTLKSPDNGRWRDHALCAGMGNTHFFEFGAGRTVKTVALSIAKAVDTTSVQYKKTTPNDVIYDNMDRHINGEGTEGNKERAAKGFLEAAQLDMETLKIKAIVKDSVFFKYIINKADGHIYHAATSTLLGRNVSDVIEFLKNPMNEDILKDMNQKIEKLWNM